MQLSISSFRGFRQARNIRLAPLTLLVGENSAGKTSFLALLRYIYASFGSGPLTFNKEPFSLGAYEQIAHYRGGKSGRAKSFGYSLLQEITPREYRLRQEEDKLPEERITLNVEFYNRFSQPALSAVSFAVGLNRTSLRLTDEKYLVSTRYRGENTRTDVSSVLSPPQSEDLASPDILSFFLRSYSFLGRYESAKKMTKSTWDRARYFAAYLDGMEAYYDIPVYASSPVRTKPDRAYTPLDILSSPEGEHIPYLLVRLKRHRTKSWTALRSRLIRFGKQSGIFTDIDVKILGRSESDPFQIFFKLGGPARNIIDVGYGVSQILPIITEIFNRDNTSLFLLQQPEVHLHPQAQAALGTMFAEESVKHRFVIETHSDYIIDRIRMAVRDKIVERSNVAILYFENDRLENRIYNIDIDELGNIRNAPPGYRRFFMQEAVKSIEG